MPRIYEIVSEQSVENLRPLLKNALEAIGLDGLEQNRKDNNLYTFNERSFSAKSSDGYEAGPLLVAAIHQELLASARFDPHAPEPFTHRTTESAATVIRRMLPGALKEGNWKAGPNQMQRFAGDAVRMMKANRLILRIAGSGKFYIRASETPLTYGYLKPTKKGKAPYVLPRKAAAELEKRIEEEAGKPVNSHFTIPALPTEATKEAILDWARRFKETFDKVNAKYEAAAQTAAELQLKVEALEKLQVTMDAKETLAGLADILKKKEG